MAAAAGATGYAAGDGAAATCEAEGGAEGTVVGGGDAVAAAALEARHGAAHAQGHAPARLGDQAGMARGAADVAIGGVGVAAPDRPRPAIGAEAGDGIGPPDQGERVPRAGGREWRGGVMVVGAPTLDVAVDDRFTLEGSLYKVTFVRPNRDTGTQAEANLVQ
jgi:hypothetical protein